MTFTPWLLGLIAGGTIFLGLPIAKLRRIAPMTQGFLNAVSTGILLFLLVEITGHLIEQLEELVEGAVIGGGGQPAAMALQYGGLFITGLSVGLLGLVAFERRFIGPAKDRATPAVRARQVGMTIAIGLGLHNLSEGLAIGQGLSAGASQLAWLLAIGFALHNATEGFGIAAPLSGHQASWKFLALAGLVAGGPTVFGAAIGSAVVSKPAEIFCLALAAGTILYIVGELLHLGRLLPKGEALVAAGLLVGFFTAMASEFAVAAASELTAAHGPRHGGVFGDASDIYHYEVVAAEGSEVAVYVSDHYNRPLDTRALQARWTLDPDGPAPLIGPLVPTPDGAALIGRLPAGARRGGGPRHLKVETLKRGAWVGMEFYLQS